MLEVYDLIIGDYLKFSTAKSKLFISTGLRQVPYDINKFYYRLKNHSIFLNNIGVKYSKVLPRMTRDFEIIFKNDVDLKNAKKILEKLNLTKLILKFLERLKKEIRVYL